jgi:hypothetical protein
MPDNNVVPFKKPELRGYLDQCIRLWREKKYAGDPIAEYYIDAFQSVRASLFDELLPLEDEPPKN